MSIATTISRITGYLRIASLAYALGILRIADSYNLANVMPNMTYELVIGGVLSSLFIPIFIEYLVQGDKDEAWYVASSVFNITTLLLATVTIFGILASFPIIRTQTLLVPSQVKSIQLVNFFFKFFIPQIIFYGFCAIFTGLLNSHKRFTIPAIAPVLNNLTVIATVFLFYQPLMKNNPQLAVTSLAIGTTLGVISMALIQIPPLLKIGIHYKPVLDFSHPAVRQLGRLSLPILGYVTANMVGLTVTNNLAYKFPGGITAYQYSWQFFQLPYGIFAVAIATAIFPTLSEYASRKDFDNFRRNFSLGVRSTAFITIPAAAVLVVLSRPIVQLFLQRGHFSSEATRLTAPVLSLFALGLFSFSTYMFLTRTFYSLQDTQILLKTNAIGVPFNICVNLILIKFLGVKGLALGHALTYTFTMSLLFWLLRRRLGTIDGKKILVSVSKILAASLVTGGVTYFARTYLPSLLASPGRWPYWRAGSFLSQASQLSLSLLLATIVYISLVYLMGVEEIKYVRQVFRKKPVSKSQNS